MPKRREHTEHYEISEMARLFGVSRQTLIYYDRIGLFKPAAVNEKGYRFYAPTQIPKLRLICILRDLGLELKEIERIVRQHEMGAVAARLTERLGDIDREVAELTAQRSYVAERLAFYRDVDSWRRRADQPILKHFPERYVVFEPFGAGEISRPVLHASLMRAVSRTRSSLGVGPVSGWGALLRRDAFRSEDVLAGGGPFVVVPTSADAAALADVITLPEGIYLCMSRWGMPYDPAGIRRLVAEMDTRRLRPVGDAFDFCLLDTTAYDDEHSVDFCCIQIPVEL